MPGNDQFKIIIDDSALDKVIEKGKKTSTELINSFNKASADLKTAFGKAFDPNQLNNFVTQVKSKLGALQSNLSFKPAVIDVDVSKISTAVGSVKNITSEIALLQSTASGAAVAIQNHFGGIIRGITDHIKILRREKKILEDDSAASLARGYKPIPSSLSSMRVSELKREEVEAKNVLKQLTNVLGDVLGVQNALDKAITKVQQTPISRKFKGYSGATAGSHLDLPTDEASKQLQDYAKKIQVKAGQVEDSISMSIENMASEVSHRIENLPDQGTAKTKAVRKQIAAQEKEYQALLGDIVNLKSKQGTPHDILGALQGQDFLSILKKLQSGKTDFDTELNKIEARAIKYKAKIDELIKKYSSLMESTPAHIKTKAGGVLIPGTPEATSVATTQAAFSDVEVAGFEKRSQQLQAIKSRSTKEIQELRDVEMALEFARKGKKRQMVPTLEAGTQLDISDKTRHSMSEIHQFVDLKDQAADADLWHESLTRLNTTGVISQKTWRAMNEDVREVGISMRSPAQEAKHLREVMLAAHGPVNAFLRMTSGHDQGEGAISSLKDMKLQMDSIVREPILKPGSASMDYAEKLKGSLGNATGYVKRELTDTTVLAERNLLRFKNIITSMGDGVTKPFQSIINQIIGVKDAAGKLQGIFPQFQIGGTTAAGVKVPYVQAFEERSGRLQNLVSKLDSSPGETLPKLNREVSNLSTSLSGVGEHFKKTNISASEMSGSFRIKPLIDDLQTLFNSPELSGHQLAQAQAVVGQINTKFSEMVKYAPALEPLRKQMQGLSTEFLKTSAFKIAADPKEAKDWEAAATRTSEKMKALRAQKPEGIEITERPVGAMLPDGTFPTSRKREVAAAGRQELGKWQRSMETLQKEYDDQMAHASRARVITPASQDSVKAAYEQFKTGIAPFAKELNFTQVISDALMQFARLARGASDVSRNTSGMADQAQRFVQLLSTASTKGLMASESEELKKITSGIDAYTVKLRSEHLPLVQTLGKEYESFHSSIGKVVGRFLTSPGRGALPELIQQKFAPHGQKPKISLEEWMEGGEGAANYGLFREPGSRGDVQFEQIKCRDPTYKSCKEITYATGHRQEREMTTAEMFGTGRFELIDSVTAKTEGFSRALGYLKNKLGETGGEFENFYQPAMQGSEKLKGHIQTLREAALTDATKSPRMASIVLSLDTAQASIGHTVSSFKFLKQSLDALDNAGGVVSPKWIANVEKGLQGITKASTSTLKSGVQQFQERIKNILGDEGSSPDQIYSAVKEGMKLPSASSSKESIASKGLGQILLGGDESVTKTASMTRITQIKGALEEYAEEVLKSGFNASTLKRATTVVSRTFAEMNKVITKRRKDYFTANKKHLEWETDPSLMPSWQSKTRETPALNKFMKGTMRGLVEEGQEADPSVYPAMDKLAERATKWPEDLVNKRMVLLKRQIRKTREEISKEMSIDEEGITPRREKLHVRDINLERAYEAMEKAKLGITRERQKQEARIEQRPFATQPQRFTEAKENEIAVAELSLIPPIDKTKKAVVGSIDEMTAAKVAALKRQVSQMKGVDPAKAVGEIEHGVVGEILKEAKGVPDTNEAGLMGSGASKKVLDLVNRFALLNNQIQTIGTAIDKQGKPLAMWAELARAARMQISDLLREISKTGVSTEFLDKQVEKFNKTAPKDKQVLSYKQLNEQDRLIRGSIANAETEAVTALKTNDPALAASAYKSQEKSLVDLNKLGKEIERTMAVTLNQEVLKEDLHRREIGTIQELGQAYKMAGMEANISLGPSSVAARSEISRTAFAGRDIAQQSLISSAFSHTGLKAGGMFENVGGPFATINDLYQKLLKVPEQLKQTGPEIKKNIDAFRELNASYGLDIPEPANLDSLVGRLKRLNALPEGQSFSARWSKNLDKDLGAAQTYFRQILTSLDEIALKSNLSQFKETRVTGIQKQRDDLKGLLHDTEQFIKLLAEANTRQGPLGGLQTRIQLQEMGSHRKQELAAGAALQHQDKETPSADIEQMAKAQADLNAGLKGGMSIWERITNTVKTARNSFADLFMYQVRWYTSMMLFWGVINKVSDTFKSLADTQHQIQRAVRSMREESGELVTNYGRMERVSTTHIFANMVKWAVDAKMAGEALYQLASAGLTATEALAALSPVLSLVRATEADTQETVKIVAGVYNVLGDTIESNIAVTTKFKIISDVMTKVFNDHQVELSELNQGYRFAIQSADMAGLSFYELSAMLGVLNDNMIKGMRAGRGLQQVLVHIAKQPYEIAASFINLARHMEVPAEIFAKLASPEIANMTTMELMREFANIAKASGRSMEQLGRIMEKFDMIGGRTLAPLLLKFHEVDKTHAQLLFNSLGATEAMASRMSTTITANLRRISSFFQASFYPLVQGTHLILAGVLGAVGKTAMAMGTAQSSIVKGSFGALNLPTLGEFMDHLTKSIILLTTLNLAFGLLDDKYNYVFKGLNAAGNGIIALFTRLGTVLKGLTFANIALGFSSGWEYSKSIVTGSISAIGAAIGATSAAYKSFAATHNFATASMLVGLSGLKGAWEQLKLLFIFLGRHPVAVAILAISTAIAGVITYFFWWKKSYDAVVVDALEANTKYLESLGKLEQKAVQAWHAIVEAAKTGKTWEGVVKKSKEEGTEEEPATPEQKAAFNARLITIGIVDDITNTPGVKLSDLRKRFEELTPKIDDAVKALHGYHNAAAKDPKVRAELSDAVSKGILSVQGARKELTDAEAVLSKERRKEGAPGGSLFGLFGYDEKKVSEAVRLVREADNAVSLANRALMDTIQTPITANLRGPIESLIQGFRDEKWDDDKIQKTLLERIKPPKDAVKIKWRPDFSLSDEKWDALIPALVADDKAFKELVGDPKILEKHVGKEWAAAISNVDLKAFDAALQQKKLYVAGRIADIGPKLIEGPLESHGIKIGLSGAWGKNQEMASRERQTVLRTEMAYEKQWTETMQKLLEARVSGMKEGYTAQQLATDIFGLEMGRLRQDYIRTEDEYNTKIAQLEKKRGGLKGKEGALQMPAVSLEIEDARLKKQMDLMKIQVQQLELVKQMGELALKSWQSSEGDVLKFKNTMKAIQAREAEAKAGEKIASIERDIASSVRASAKEVQEAHRFKMEAIRLELAAKKGEAEYTMMAEKLKHEAEINALQDPEKRKQMNPEQAKWTDNRIAMLQRQTTQVKAIHDATVSAADAASKRSLEVEGKRHQAMNVNKMLHDIKVFLGDIQEVEASARSIMSSFSAPSTGKLTSTMYDDRKGRPQGHFGGDISGAPNDPVYATTDMMIKNVSDSMSDARGGMVFGIDAQGVWHKFVHVKPGVRSDQQVKAGDQIAVLSDLGKGTHLDYKQSMGIYGQPIDWMAQAGLSKGANLVARRATGNIPLSTPMEASRRGGDEDEFVDPKNLAEALRRLIAYGDKVIADEGDKAKGELKLIVTGMLNGLKDMQIEPDQINAFQSIFNSMEVLWQKAGLKMKKFYPLIIDSFKKEFDKGFIIDIPLMVQYTSIARKAGETEEQIRKRVFEATKTSFENEENWTKAKMHSMVSAIAQLPAATGVSGKKLDTFLFSEVFSPSKLQTMIDSDIDLIEMVYQELSQLSRNLTGGIPVKAMKSFETVIKGIIGAGEELDVTKYNALVSTLSKISSISLKEASDSIEKYWVAVANTREFNMVDIARMDKSMRQFGATQDEVWKAIGDVADIQIRRLYASWEKGAKGMKGDLDILKEVGEAFWFGMLKGVADFTSKIKDPIRRLAENITQILGVVQSTLEEIIVDFAMKTPKTMQEYMNKIWEAGIKMGAKNLVESVMSSAMSGFKQLAEWISPSSKEPGKDYKLTQEEAEAKGAKFGELTYRKSSISLLERIAKGIESLKEGTGIPSGGGTFGDQFGSFGLFGSSKGTGLSFADSYSNFFDGPKSSFSDSYSNFLKRPSSSFEDSFKTSPGSFTETYVGGEEFQKAAQGLRSVEAETKAASSATGSFLGPLSAFTTGLRQLGGGDVLGAIFSFISALSQLIQKLMSLGSSGGKGGGGGGLFGIFKSVLGIASSIFGGFGGGTGLGLGDLASGAGSFSAFDVVGSGAGMLFNYIPGSAGGLSIGGTIPGIGDSDTVPAWLTPGEFVINKNTARFFGTEFFHNLQKFAQLSQPDSVFSGSMVPHKLQSGVQKFQSGGEVGHSFQGMYQNRFGESVRGSSPTESNFTFVTVVDEESVEKFLGLRKYGNVIVNKLGNRIMRKVAGGRSL